MKKLLFFIALLLTFFSASAQEDTTRYQKFDVSQVRYKGVWANDYFRLPDTASVNALPGALGKNPLGTRVFLWDGSKWNDITTTDQYDVCGNLIQPNLSNILKTGSFLDNDYTVDMNDHDFTIGGRGVFIIDGDKFYVNNIEGTADTDSVWALNKNNKVVKIPNGGQYWQAINGGTTLNNKGSSILNIKFNLPFTVDSISTQYLLKLGAPGFVPVSFGSINNNIAVYSDAGYPSFKLNKAGLDTFYRKLTGTFTGDHFANLQDKNGTLAYWGDNLSLFTNDINFDGVYFKQSNLFSEISGAPNKAIARTNIGASVAGSNIFKITDPSAVSWIRINADNSVSSRTATQTLDDLGGTTIGQNIFTLTNPSAVRYLKINADNTVSARTASSMLGDLSAAPLASPSFTGTLVSAGTVTITNGNLVLGTAGKGLTVTEGTGGKVGQSTLVSGTKAITITGLTTSSRAFVQLVTASGVTLTVNYQAVCSANTLTVQANIAAGTINTADGSTFNYWIIN